MSEEVEQVPEGLAPSDSQFVEDMGVSLEAMGVPRAAGRLLGWLLICDPPAQSAGELADALQASAGSVSMSVRLLDRNGLVERLGVPGSRRAYYRIRDDAWVSMMREQVALMDRWSALATEGLGVLAERPAAQHRRLEEMREFMTYMSEEMVAATDRYREKKEKTHE